MINYVRAKNGTPKGILVAKLFGNKVGFGYALCSKKDIFQKKTGRLIAERRAEKHVNCEIIKVPHTLVSHMVSMMDRAKQYFADKEFTTSELTYENPAVK